MVVEGGFLTVVGSMVYGCGWVCYRCGNTDEFSCGDCGCRDCVGEGRYVEWVVETGVGGGGGSYCGGNVVCGCGCGVMIMWKC